MKKLRYLCLVLLLLVSHDRLSAQVIDISHYKSVVYQQTSPAQTVTPRLPDVYNFHNLLDADPFKSLEYSPFMVFTPSTSPDAGEFVMFENSTYFFSYSSPFFATKSIFDAEFPNGLYNYVTTYSDPMDGTPRSDNVLVQIPTNEFYSATLPLYAADCWTAMQSMDPAVDFTLSWNSYSQMPDTDFAVTFVSTFDSQTFDSTYGAFNYNGSPDITTVTIPAGTLTYGRTYIVELFFSNRITPPGTTNQDGSLVSLTIGNDVITDATLVTIPPPLQIALTGPQCVTLSWPTLATNYTLQSTIQLGAGNNWTNITDIPLVNDSTNSVMIKATQTQAFFRLAPSAPQAAGN